MSLHTNKDDRLISEAKESGWFQFSSPLRYIIAILVIIFLIISAWYLLSASDYKNYSKTDLPLIRAEEAPYKVKAENQDVPGVQHQDKLVYGRIRNDEAPPPVEHILPEPEAPLSQLIEGESLKMVEQYIPDIDPDIEPREVIPIVNVAHTDKSLSIEDLIAGQTEDTLQSSPQSEPEGTVYIQLGSLKSYDQAEAEWTRLQKKHLDILPVSFKPTIQKVDLGAEKGIFYRLRTGPYGTKETATTVCTTLKDRKVDCIVIR